MNRRQIQSSFFERSARLLVSSIVILVMIVGVIQAQDDSGCDLDTAQDFRSRADDHSDAGDYERAIADLTCAIKLEGDNPDYYNERAIAYHYLGDTDQALADYEQAMDIDPLYAYAYNNRGTLFHERGDYEAALADYNLAIELYEISPVTPYTNRGSLYQEQGEYELALADLNQVIELDPTYDMAYLARAWTYLMMGQDDRSHPDFAEWISLIQTDEFRLDLEDTPDQSIAMSEGLVYRFTFEAQAGQEFNASAMANLNDDVDPLLVLLDAYSTAIISDDDSGVNLDAVIAGFVLTADGLYTLLLSHAGGGSEGEITLTVEIGDEGLGQFAVYNLFIQELAEVYTTGGDRLNLRAAPGLDFEIIDRLERGELVTLLEGPRKTDGYAWWRVRSDDGIIGWAVERVEEEQTLQLALLVGEQAIVTSGEESLNVREEAGTAGPITFQLVNSQQVTLLEMPQFVDGYRWWRIRTEDGQEGWTVDRVEGERMLIPAREHR